MIIAVRAAIDERMPREPHRLATVFTVGHLRVLIFLLVTAVSVALPAIQVELDLTTVQVAGITTAYLIPLCALLLLAGRAGDRFGHRRVAIAGTLLFAAGSVVAALAPGYWPLLAGRALEGVGAALIVPGLTAMMVWVTPPRARGRTDGLLVAAMMAGIAFGPFVAGVVVVGAGWRAIFALAALAAIAIVPVLVTRCAEPGGDHGMPAARGVAFLWAAGAALLLAGFAAAPGQGFGSPFALGPVAAGLLLLAACVRLDRRSARPYLDDRMVRLPIYVAAVVAAAAYGWIALGFQVITLRYLQLSFGLDPVLSGLALVPALLPIACIAPFTGVIVDRAGHRRPILAGFAIAALALVLIGTRIAVAGSPGHLLAFALLGVGLGLLLTPLETAAMARMDRAIRGTAAGLFQTARETGGVLGVAILGIVYVAMEAETMRRSVAALPDAAALMSPAQLDGLMAGAPSLVAAIARSDSELSGLVPSIVADAIAHAYELTLAVSAVVAIAALVVVRAGFPPRTVADRSVEADVERTAGEPG